MSDIVAIALGVAGGAGLYFGAEMLVNGGVSIANRLRVPKSIVAITLVAFGTSAPELVVSVNSAIQSLGDVSVGNVIGSNICNILLILGVSGAIVPMGIDRGMRMFDIPVMVIASIGFSLICCCAGGIGRPAAAAFLAFFIVYMWFRIRHRGSINADEVPPVRYSLPVGTCIAAAGIAILVISAKLFVDGAVALAALAGVPEAVIALTVVALGTSLPELATSVIAAMKGENDMAVGNIVGSNIFNILVIMGVSPLIRPIRSGGIVVSDHVFMLAASAALCVIAALPGHKLPRWCGWLFLAGYVVYVATLVAR